MMYIFATDLMRSFAQGKKVVEDGNSSNAIYFDVGVTNKPYFHDKATAIAQSSCYECPETGCQPEQVHLIGFDTLIRLLDVKYYPPAHTLQPLDPFFARHRVRVTRRTDDAWGGREEQDAYFKALAEGARERDGGKREWAGRIGLEDGREEGEEPVSSSRVRDAANGGNLDALRALVTDEVRTYIIEERLYMDGG